MKKLSPKQQYLKTLDSEEFQADPQQEKVINELDRVYHQLLPRFNATVFTCWYHKTPVMGLYLWGGVGIGKTWLMDLFYHSLPVEGKLRLHFHRFMKQIHSELKQLQGRKNPLSIMAKRLRKKYHVICFDEFFVSDITDAMLLAELFRTLFAEGITLVTTSNIQPDLLYKGGISRDRFLPAIALLNKYTDVIHLTTQKDYRKRTLEQAGIYYTPINQLSQKNMRERFFELADSDVSQGELLIVEGRGILTVRSSKSVVWFNFNELCNIPRSQVDYLEIAKSFHTVLLSNVPKLTVRQTNEALYLINLVDVFYDAQVKLIISAACEIKHLYTEGELTFEFQRTMSRLQEMQSLEYLQKPHLC